MINSLRDEKILQGSSTCNQSSTNNLDIPMFTEKFSASDWNDKYQKFAMVSKICFATVRQMEMKLFELISAVISLQIHRMVTGFLRLQHTKIVSKNWPRLLFLNSTCNQSIKDRWHWHKRTRRIQYFSRIVAQQQLNNNYEVPAMVSQVINCCSNGNEIVWS